MATRIYIGFGAALIAVLMLASLGFAQQGRWADQQQGYGPGWTQLDEQQQQEILERKQEHQQEVYPKRQEMIAKQAELNALLAQEDPDPGKIQELKNELMGLNQELFEMRLEHRIENRQELGACPGYGSKTGRGGGPGGRGGPGGPGARSGQGGGYGMSW